MTSAVFDPYVIACQVIDSFCGKKGNFIKQPCDILIKNALYEEEFISWSAWGKDFKKPLIDKYFNVHYQVWKTANDEATKKGTYEYPKLRDARAIRLRLAELFPKVLGYGVVYDRKFNDAYESHQNKFKDKERQGWQDQMYCSLEDRINEHKDYIKTKTDPKSTDF